MKIFYQTYFENLFFHREAEGVMKAKGPCLRTTLKALFASCYRGSMVWQEPQLTVLLPHVAALPLWQEILLQLFVPLFHVPVFSAFFDVS